MTALLDVNVLIALAWPNHVHHEAARAWFTGRRREGWATCLLTEAGFVRVSCNPSVVRHSVTPADAILHLRRLRRLESHAFWSLDRSLLELPEGGTRPHSGVSADNGCRVAGGGDAAWRRTGHLRLRHRESRREPGAPLRLRDSGMSFRRRATTDAGASSHRDQAHRRRSRPAGWGKPLAAPTMRASRQWMG